MARKFQNHLGYALRVRSGFYRLTERKARAERDLVESAEVLRRKNEHYELARTMVERANLRAQDGDFQGAEEIETAVEMHVVTDVLGADPHGALLDTIAAVDDYLDSIIDAGVVEGAAGLDDRAWTLDYPKAGAGARVASAQATQTLVVKVQREQNREPAP